MAVVLASALMISQWWLPLALSLAPTSLLVLLPQMLTTLKPKAGSLDGDVHVVCQIRHCIRLTFHTRLSAKKLHYTLRGAGLYLTWQRDDFFHPEILNVGQILKDLGLVYCYQFLVIFASPLFCNFKKNLNILAKWKSQMYMLIWINNEYKDYMTITKIKSPWTYKEERHTMFATAISKRPVQQIRKLFWCGTDWTKML